MVCNVSIKHLHTCANSPELQHSFAFQEQHQFVMTSVDTSWTMAVVFLWQSGMLGSMWVVAELKLKSWYLLPRYVRSLHLKDDNLPCYLQAVTPKIVHDVCSKYIYDKCPAVAAVGEYWVYCLCRRVRADSRIMSLICPFLCLSSRPRWAAARLQQNAQCHVLAQILIQVVVLLRVSHICSSVFSSDTQMSSSYH